jgi:hypothetical protein
MSLADQLAAIAPIVAFCVGVGLSRRGHRRIGIAAAAVGVVAALIMAATGAWRPLLGLIAISGFLVGIEVDVAGSAGRRALGMLGVAVGLFALLTAAVYA